MTSIGPDRRQFMEPGKIYVVLAGEAGEQVALMLELDGKHAQARLEPEHAETVAADLRHHAAMARRRRRERRIAGEVPPDERFNIGPGSLDVRVEVDPNG